MTCEAWKSMPRCKPPPQSRSRSAFRKQGGRVRCRGEERENLTGGFPITHQLVFVCVCRIRPYVDEHIAFPPPPRVPGELKKAQKPVCKRDPGLPLFTLAGPSAFAFSGPFSALIFAQLSCVCLRGMEEENDVTNEFSLALGGTLDHRTQ
jgi:hypothetical protein